MRNKKTIFGIMIGIIFLIVVGISYAYFSAILDLEGEPNQIVTETGDLKLTYTDGNEIKGINVTPGWSDDKVFSVENTGSLQAYYSINWSELNNGIIKDELVVSATCERTIDGVVNGTCNSINETIVGTTDGPIIEDIPIEAEVKHTYHFTITFKEINSVQNYNQGKSFHGTIIINEYFHWYQECNDNPNNLNCKMLSDSVAYSEEKNSPYVTGSYYDIILWRFFEGGRAPLTDYSSGEYYYDNYKGTNYTTAVVNNYVGEGTWTDGSCYYEGEYVVDWVDGIVVEEESDCGAVYKTTWDEYIHLDLTLMNDLESHVVSSGEGIDFDRMSGETN